MSLVVRYWLRCNHCGRLLGNGYVSAAETRSVARRNGWKRSRRGSSRVGRDACPSCARELGLS